MKLLSRMSRAVRHLVPRNPVAGEIYAGSMLGRASLTLLRGGTRNGVLHPLMRSWRISSPGRPLGGLAIHWARSLIRDATRDGPNLIPLADNEILAEFVDSKEAARIRRNVGAFPMEDRVRLRGPRPNDDPERQGNILILKAPVPSTGEKGVMLIKYSEAIRTVAAIHKIEEMVQEYALVLEPSSWGYADLPFLLYLGSDARVVVQTPVEKDWQFLESLDANLEPIALGAGDWVDSEAFRPRSDHAGRTWDVAMIASWKRLKRHAVLFKALGELRSQGHRLSAVFVGTKGDLTLTDLREMARANGVLDQCTFFEAIPHERVAEVLARSKISVLLSKQEGASKAIYESMFADTHILVPRGHLGVNREHMAEVGHLFSDSELPELLLRLCRADGSPGSRDWALAHTGARHSTRVLNARLAKLAERSGEPWTTDLAPKMNDPGLFYLEPGRYREFEDHYRRLERYLR